MDDLYRLSSAKEQLHRNVEDFIAAGVSCYAFTLIHDIGLLKELLKEKGVSSDLFKSYPNPLVIVSAFQTLEKNDIIFCKAGNYFLTPFGMSLARHLGSIGLIYSGYAKVLANQMKIARDQPSRVFNLIDFDAVSRASSFMGDCFYNDMLVKMMIDHSVSGTICDLGCGHGTTLMHLCRRAELPGLGFEISESSIKCAKEKLTFNDNVSFEVQDITKIDNVYPDVEVLMQAFVMHDFSSSICKKTMRSFLKCFPNARLFVYIDAVAPEADDASQLPGFDYVHSLLGVKTRTLSETSKLITESGFEIMNIEHIQELTNCHIWTLKPANVSNK